jgi:hypothetical protein
MSSDAFLFVVLPVGGALLAFWAIFRFPQFGPRTISGAIAHMLIAFATAAVTPPSLIARAASAWGVVPALICVVLPSLVYVFWAAGRLIHIVQEPVARDGVRSTRR